MTDLEEIKKRFDNLCNKQESIYRPEFESVFSILYSIDEEQRSIYDANFWFMAEPLPDAANEAILNEALQEAGFSKDKAFCNAFIDYCNIVIEGKRLKQKMLFDELTNDEEQEQQEQQANGWKFIELSIIAPQEIHQKVIEPMMQEDAKAGRGLFANVTQIPIEQDLDEFLMIEPYNIKNSFVPYLDELKRFKVVGEEAFLCDEFTRGLFALLRECALFIQNHTDKPSKTKNYISSIIKELDKVPIWGLFIQILLLQGLCRWLEDSDINEGEKGYKEAESMYYWLCEELMEKETGFCCKPYGDEDKKRLQPLCSYLYSTEIGQFVQNTLFRGSDSIEPQQENGLETVYNEVELGFNDEKIETRGRKKKPFVYYVTGDEAENIKTLHNAMKGKKGKDAALIIRVAVIGGLITKPTFQAVVDEFGDIGNRSGYNKYMSENYRFTEDEIAGAKAQLNL